MSRIGDDGQLSPLEGASFGRGIMVAVVIYGAAMVAFGLLRATMTGDVVTILLTVIIALGTIALVRCLTLAHADGES